jgi:HSP20 family protein
MSSDEETREEETQLARTPFQRRSMVRNFDSIFDTFRQDFDDLFNTWWPLTPLRPTSRLLVPSVRAPLMDLVDNGDSFTVRAEVPGIPKENLEVEVTSEYIELNGKIAEEKSEEGENYLMRERSSASFRRQLSFPAEVVAKEAKADLRDGVLHVNIPKKEPTEAEDKVKLDISG